MGSDQTPSRQPAATARRKDFASMMEESIPKFKEIIPATARKFLTPERIVRLSMNAFSKSKDLQECTPVSILNAIITAVQLGFEPNGPLGHCYLVPYNEKVKRNGVEESEKRCQCQIGYKGFCDLARRTADYSLIDSRLIREKDAFTLRYTPAPDFVHIPDMGDDPGNSTHAYAYAYLKGSSLPIFEVMTWKEIDAIRKQSRSANSPAWRNHEGEMQKKVVMKRMLKDQPLSIELADAIQYDNNQSGIDFDARPALSGGNAGLLKRLEGEGVKSPEDEDDEALDVLAASEQAPE